MKHLSLEKVKGAKKQVQQGKSIGEVARSLQFSVSSVIRIRNEDKENIPTPLAHGQGIVHHSTRQCLVHTARPIMAFFGRENITVLPWAANSDWFSMDEYIKERSSFISKWPDHWINLSRHCGTTLSWRWKPIANGPELVLWKSWAYQRARVKVMGTLVGKDPSEKITGVVHRLQRTLSLVSQQPSSLSLIPAENKHSFSERREKKHSLLIKSLQIFKGGYDYQSIKKSGQAQEDENHSPQLLSNKEHHNYHVKDSKSRDFGAFVFKTSQFYFRIYILEDSVSSNWSRWNSRCF